MAYQDLLLVALTYPDATPDRAVRSGVALARRLGGELTLLTVRIEVPHLGQRLSKLLVHVDRLAEEEEARSAATAQLETMCARIAAEEAGQVIHTESVAARLFEQAETVCHAARTRDLTLVAIGPATLADRDVAESVLFGSGHPVLIYPEDQEIVATDGFDAVAVAWDGGARAARAVAEALPLLRRAKSVRIFMALDDKPRVETGSAKDLVRHLRVHGVAAAVDERHAHDRPIGVRLADYIAETRPDLLVMGGFGHARLREFILGGATEAVLAAPPCPVLLCH